VEYRLPGNVADFFLSVFCQKHLLGTVRFAVLNKAKRYGSDSIAPSVLDAAFLVGLFRDDQAPSGFCLKRLRKLQMRDYFGSDSKLRGQLRQDRPIDSGRVPIRLRVDAPSREYRRRGQD
jgi:hypothetical protein